MKDAIKLVGSAVAILVVVLLAIRFGAQFGAEPKSTTSSQSENMPKPATAQPEPEATSTRSNADIESLRDQMYEAYGLAEEEVRQQLTSPSTAKFSTLGYDTEAKIAPYGYHQWLCAGFVDAQNAFGVPIRHEWGACIFDSTTIWHVDYMEIDNQGYGRLPQRIPFPVSPPSPSEIAAAKAKAGAAKKAAETKALQYDQDLATTNNAFGLLRMGERYRDGDGVTNNLALARDYLQRAAKAGDPTAADELKNLPVK